MGGFGLGEGEVGEGEGVQAGEHVAEDFELDFRGEEFGANL